MLPRIHVDHVIDPESILIATDGSAVDVDDGMVGAWAFAIFFVIDSVLTFAGYTGGFTCDDPQHLSFGGTTSQRSHDSEFTATVHALWWLLSVSSRFNCKCCFLSDALLTLRSVSGEHRWKAHPRQATILRSLGRVVETKFDMNFQHVKSHTGMPLN